MRFPPSFFSLNDRYLVPGHQILVCFIADTLLAYQIIKFLIVPYVPKNKLMFEKK